MNNLTKNYEAAKRNANEFMNQGNITKYIESLLELNKYKNLLTSIIAN